MIIKICGIRTPTDASFAINAGANWIGIIRHPESVRYVELDEAQKIAAATHAAGGMPVAVFTDSSAEEMLAFCQQSGITHVQLHGSLSRQQQHLLPADWVRIYVRMVEQNGRCLDDVDGGQCSLNPQRDYLLFDGLQAGSGQHFVWQALTIPTGMRFLIAGGLHANNVATAIQQLHPDGVDVSSGVESARGVKSQPRIIEFINQVR